MEHVTDRSGEQRSKTGAGSTAPRAKGLRSHFGSMTAPRAKAPRLASFGRESILTRRALAATLKKVKEEGLPTAVSASSKRRDDKRLLADAARGGSFGPLIVDAVLVGTDCAGRARHPAAQHQGGRAQASEWHAPQNCHGLAWDRQSWRGGGVRAPSRVVRRRGRRTP